MPEGAPAATSAARKGLSRHLAPEHSDEPYAAQLARGHGWLRFAAPLEQEFRGYFRRASLRRIQVAFIGAIALLLLSLPLVAFVFEPPAAVRRWSDTILLGVLLPVFAASLVLSVYDRRARYLQGVVLFDLLLATGLLVTLRVVYEQHGVRYPFTTETYLCIVIFLLSGWRFFMALGVALATLTVIVTVDLAYGVAAPAVVEHAFNLFATGALASAGCYLTEHITRTNFLYHRIRRFRAERDGLTRLLNRRAFDEELARIWREAYRERKQVGVMIADVDHFKRYNDGYGHAQGDVALKTVADVLRTEVARRPLDLASRLGGEEFAVVWYDVGPEAVAALTERFRAAVAALGIEHRDTPGGRLTVSCGYAIRMPATASDFDEAVEAADYALYQAKATRNRAVGAPPHYEPALAA